VVIADKFDPNANTQIVSAEAIPDGWMVSHRLSALLIAAFCSSSLASTDQANQHPARHLE
jgi:hypothetical protein